MGKSHLPNYWCQRKETMRVDTLVLALRLLTFIIGAFLVVYCAILLKRVSNGHGHPHTVHRTIHSVTRGCRFVRGGPELAADSNGKVCLASTLATNGCCAQTIRGCRQCVKGCCDEYTTCVSCCTKAQPSHLRHYRIHSNDTFALCVAACRTNRYSVVHENAYRSRLRHCYGTDQPPIDLNLHRGVFDFAEPVTVRRRIMPLYR